MYGGGGQNPGQAGGGNDSDALYAAAMMAALAQQEQKPKYSKYLEGLLPLVLLLILGGFIAVRMGIIDLSWLPGMQKKYEILVLTDNPESPDIIQLQNMLQTGLGEYLNIYPSVSVAEVDPAAPITAEQLGMYDVVILWQVSPDYREKKLTLSQRDEIYKYLRGGGNLIVIMNSGVCDEDSCIGWGGGLRYDLGEFMPVTCLSGTEFTCTDDNPISGVRFRFTDPNHPINPYPGVMYYPREKKDVSLKVLKGVRVSRSGKRIAIIQKVNNDGSVDSTYLGIAATESLFGSKVVYIGFEPTVKPFDVLLYKTILWIAG